jgi:hypothetical protein
MNSYLQINDGTTNKYLRVVAPSYEVGHITPELVTRSLTSKAVRSIATPYRYWQFVARVQATESGSYAPWSTIEGWLTKTSLTLTDFENNSYPVVLVTGGTLTRQHQVSVIDSAQAFSYVALRFEELL